MLNALQLPMLWFCQQALGGLATISASFIVRQTCVYGARSARTVLDVKWTVLLLTRAALLLLSTSHASLFRYSLARRSKR
jgi:hypothetical protein